MRYVLMLAAMAPIAAQAAPTVEVTGSCPGSMDITVTDITPFGDMTLLFGPSLGADVIPAGGCRGVPTGLDPARWILTVPDMDGDGVISFSPTVPGSACDKFIQALDPGDCSLSGTFLMSDAEPGDGGFVSELTAGDLLFVGMNQDDTDDYAFVAMTGIAAGTQVFFTDNGVFDDGTLRATEGTAEWVAATDIPAGTTIVASTEGINTLALSSSGDQVTAYQGDLDLPATYIAQINVNDPGFVPTADSSNNTALAPGLTEFDTALAAPESDNMTFVPLADTLSRAELRGDVMTFDNWSGDNGVAWDFTTMGNFTFTD